MKAKVKKLLSYFMFLLLIGLIFHFLFNYIKTPNSTAWGVMKNFAPGYIIGTLSLASYFIWGNTVHDF